MKKNSEDFPHFLQTDVTKLLCVRGRKIVETCERFKIEVHTQKLLGGITE